jgi:predicted PurR-regulated permease PerM
MTTLALAIVAVFGLAAMIIAVIVLVHAKRASRIANYHEKFERAAAEAREAGVRTRDQIRRDANTQLY